MSYFNKPLRIIVIFILVVGSQACADCQKTTAMLDHMDEKFIELDNEYGESILLRVKVADETIEQAAGFQHICPERIADTAILFVFDTAKKPAFHMRNVYASLDIAFIWENGLIGDILFMREEITTGNHQLYRSEILAKYALEVRDGFFLENGIKKANSWLKSGGL